MITIYEKLFRCEIKTPDTSQGIVTGYASTFGNVDRDGDIFDAGAFSKSLRSLRKSGLMIPLLSAHQQGETIGAIDPRKAKEDAKGLHIEGQLDLNVQKARDTFSLIKTGGIQAFSIGFSVGTRDDMELIDDGGVRFKSVDLHEVSLVAVPANPQALVEGLKAVGAAKDLPLADEDRPWSSPEAQDRVRAFTDSTDGPSAAYRRAFMFFDAANADNFTAYKLPFADVINGKLLAVPRALSAIVAVLNGGRGGVDIPASDRATIKTVVSGYFKKMGKDDPFGKNEDGKNEDGKSAGAGDELALLPLLLKLKRINHERHANDRH